MLTHMRARKYKRIKKSSDLVPRFRESNVEIIRFIRGEVLNSVDDRGFAAARVSVMLCLARSQDEWAPPLEMLPTFINHSARLSAPLTHSLRPTNRDESEGKQ